ncbi:phosphopentomutase [Halotalea alkalilenta]|uniref:Phosphopentomutase n=1 Tax=Halotalea alkalilenta TaxID=376489 RepID=A0A172YEP6_9GAMM|nr:phosphopentomutase [Halotalea alkalilenta]ANF57694.1 phosphopentomutase [Halotalea alkalilenta]
MRRFKRIHLIVLDSVGIGEAPDAAAFGDLGADTLGHIGATVEDFHLPHLAALGLSNIRTAHGLAPIDGVPAAAAPTGRVTRMIEASKGKDTMTGHWELMGLKIDTPFQVFPEGFPPTLIERIETLSGRRVIGNKPASGTDVLDELGMEQIETGALIVYTSADSVLQIAAHEEVVPIDELYAICAKVRELTLAPDCRVGRVIARPFLGHRPGEFMRTANRHDYALKPFAPTVLDALEASGFATIGIGKIGDIFDGQGISRSLRTQSNAHGIDTLLELLDEPFEGLSFLNLVDFDAIYGHRRDPRGYARALEAFDSRLPELLAALQADDLLLITADHGNDPTFRGTDHTRERVPLIACSPRFAGGGVLPERTSFADVGATIAENFGVAAPDHGESFLVELN